MRGDTPVLLRGVCFSNWFWIPEPGILRFHNSEADYIKLAAMNLNTVRFYMSASMFEDPDKPYVYPEENFKWLDTNIDWARKHGIWLILDMHVPQGGYQSDGDGSPLWDNRENQKRLLALWQYIAWRYRDEPVIAGYDLLNEPVVTRSNSQWESLAGEIVNSIRSVDTNHLLIVANTMRIMNRPLSYDRAGNFSLVDDDNVMYTFHFYHPIEYTHQLAPWTPFGHAGKYPDAKKTNLTVFNPLLRFVLKRDKTYLEYEMDRMTAFGKKHNLPMYVGEFGAYRSCHDGRGGLQWLEDVLNLLNRKGLHYTYHSYHESSFGFYTNDTGLPDTRFERKEITDLFTRKAAESRDQFQ